AKAHVTLYRFTDRALVDQIVNDWFGVAINGYNLDTVADRSTKVFEGTLAIAAVPNKQVTTTIPIDQLIKTLQPGVYVALATPDGDKPDQDVERATQWFSVSDIGLVTVKTAEGLLVSARSLQTAKPVAGVDLKLIAQSNEILGTYKTDREGRFMIPGGLLRGEHGDTPKIVAAVTPAGDFTWLQLDAPALDLSDLDIKGRAPPETNDAFLWTDRGVYRPGETIHLGALLRDRATKPVTGVPMTLHIVRPDGIEVEKRVIDLASASGGTLDFHVPDNAYSGTWRLWASAGDKKEIGTTSVSVQDFVPPRLEAKLSVPAGTASIDAAIEATVAADYFYGSPGSDLTGQVEATLQAAAHPFKGFEDFSFGLVQEPFLQKALTAQDFTTDDKGKAAVVFPAEDTPDTTSPLEVVLHATVNDVDGRPAQVDLTKVLHTADRFIGLDAKFGEGLADGADAGFDVVMLDGDGKPIASQTIKWDLVLEDYQYSYFYRDGRWQSKETIIDARVNGSDLALDANGRGTISAPVKSGRWRLEAYDASGKTATSLRFGAGWWSAGQSDNRKPEVMAVTVDANAPAGKVRAMVEPSFAGRVLVMLDGAGLHGIQEKEMPKGGGAVEFDAADVPPSGAYVLAVAISPAGAVLPRLPVRAVGLAWVPGATAAHKLEVALKAPDTVHPKAKFDVDVSVTGGSGEDTYVTLAAVDEAVLRMTDFATPDPAEFYLGRREPGFELRDIYGSLIDPSGQPGQLTQGGDGNANLKAGGLDVKTFKTVALFQGPVKLDAQGHATLSVDVPEFSGRLRLMAVAWTGDRFGHADRPVTVRPPLLAELTLPRFLAPGDKATARLMLTDLEAPEQSYAIAIKTEGAVSLDKADALFKDVKRDKRRYVDRVLTASAVPGVGRIHMTATGEDGSVTERDFEIAVRTPNAYATNRQIITLAPGQHLVADDALGQELVPGTGTLAITASNVPAFDVPGLLAALRSYPYGCAEQTISRAFPELFVSKLGGKLAVPVADTVTGQGAIQRLFSLQSSDGSFGYWSAFDTGNLWLTAYAVDFLQHARAQGLSVPESMETRAVTWLVGRFATVDTSPQEAAGAAYSAIVLARASKLDLSQLRYVASRLNGHLPSDIARFQLAAALHHVGERDLATGLIEAAAITRDPKIYLNDYGSKLRDQAMALSLSAEEKLVPDKALFSRATDLARNASGTGWLSTQEQAWLLRSAFDLHTTAPLRVDLDGKTTTGTETSLTASIPLGKGRKSDLTNHGKDPVYVSLASTGIPSGVQPAEAMGFTITRSYFALDGAPANLADVHQNDELVIVVEGTMADAVERKVLAVDMLPAGLEPETIGLSGDRDTGQFAWLKDVTDPTFTALRDDRYLAGIDLSGEKARFKFAYVVRAVTPGSYARPGPQIEDMYAPAYHARGDAGTLEVLAARKVADATAPAKPGKTTKPVKTPKP
uniref:alpha-2-macroglobulin family protein n=1 Tax=Beijerinckia sp. L45 TaxID=1641855 RepID=UPI00131DCE20